MRAASVLQVIFIPKRPQPQDTNKHRAPTDSITYHGPITIKRLVTPTPRFAMSVDVWRCAACRPVPACPAAQRARCIRLPRAYPLLRAYPRAPYSPTGLAARDHGPPCCCGCLAAELLGTAVRPRSAAACSSALLRDALDALSTLRACRAPAALVHGVLCLCTHGHAHMLMCGLLQLVHHCLVLRVHAAVPSPPLQVS